MFFPWISCFLQLFPACFLNSCPGFLNEGAYIPFSCSLPADWIPENRSGQSFKNKSVRHCILQGYNQNLHPLSQTDLILTLHVRFPDSACDRNSYPSFRIGFLSRRNQMFFILSFSCSFSIYLMIAASFLPFFLFDGRFIFTARTSASFLLISFFQPLRSILVLQ